jgi:hypothetical protein
MHALPADILAKVLEALRTHRNARLAAKLVGVNQATAWRIAKKHGITLISRAEHMKARRVDPAFVAKQAPAAREAASNWLTAQHAKPKFHKKSIEAARRNLRRLNRDPAFRQASSERLKRLHEDPAFGAKLEAARDAARKRRSAQLRGKAIEAALRTLTRLDDDSAFRLAASERLNRLLHSDPGPRGKEAAARRAARNRGFAIAPILYLLGLIGVGAGVLFSGYSQILRSNQTMSNTLASKNDLQGTATTLAASSWLSTDQTLLCPPMVGSNSPSTPSTKCSTATNAITVGTSFANAVAASLPANYASVSSAGSPVEVGVFAAGSGAKVLDPWGHYYIYCRWENSIGTANAIMVISAGADGKLATTCGSTAAGGDNLFVVWTTAVTQNRAAVWQTTTSGTAVTGAQFGATGTQVNIQTNGDVAIPGTLGVTGATALGTGGLSVTGTTALAGLSASTGTFSGALSGTNGSFSGTLSASGTTTLGNLSAGTSTLSSLAVTNNGTIGGTLGVTGVTTLGALTAGSSTLSSLSVTTGPNFLGGNTTTSTGLIQIGTTVSASGTAAALLTVGKAVSNVYPFFVDQYGDVTGGTFTGTTFTGSLLGSQSGGSVAATTLTASSTTTLSSTLGVTGVTTLSAQLNGANAIFSGNVQAASFTGTMSLGGGGGVTLSGVVPIGNGGTGQTSAGNALSALFAGAGTIAQMIPGADIVNNSITTTQLNTTGVVAGTYSSVTVGLDGRVTSGTGTGGLIAAINDGSGDSVTVGTTGIVYAIGSSTVGNWSSTGLMVGSSKAALDKLDVYGATAIGTSYAGTTAAPANGLIVQGNVGIGTNNPLSYALDVNGTVNATLFSGSGAGLTGIGTSNLTGVTGTPSSSTFLTGNGTWTTLAGAGGATGSGTANYVPLWTSATALGNSVIYQSSSSVGIGTTSPAAPLDMEEGNNTTTTAPLVASPTNSTAYVANAYNNTTLTALGGATDANLDQLTINPASTVSSAIAGRYENVLVPATASYNDTSSIFGNETFVADESSVGTSGSLYGGEFYAHFDGAATRGSIFGVYGRAVIQSYNSTNQASVVSNLYGGEFLANENSTGGSVTNNAIAVYASTSNSGTIANQYGVYAAGSNSGTVTNSHGVYITGFASGTQTNPPYDLYAADSGAYNYFGGPVLMGGTTLPVMNTAGYGSIQFECGSGFYGNGQSTGFANGAITSFSPTAPTLYLPQGCGENMAMLELENDGVLRFFTGGYTGAPSGATYTQSEVFDILNNGNVGIGSTAPVNALDIGTSGGIHIASGTPGSTTNALYNNAGTLTWNGVALGTSGGGSGTVTPSTVGQVAYFQSTGSTVIGTTTMYISSGDVGIGTASPANLLDVNGAASVGYNVAAPSNGLIVSGNVGIGTASPGQLLEISKNQILPTLISVLNSNNGSVAGTGIGLGNNSGALQGEIFLNSSGNATYGGANSLNISNNLAAPIAFFTSNTERMRIDSSGNAGIGTTSPQNLLDVNGAASIGYNVAAPTGGLLVSGNVGIGTTAPGYTLQVNGSVAVANNTGLIWSDSGGTFGNQIVRQPSDGSMKLTSGQADILLMPASYVGIGLTSPGAPLEVRGTSAGYASNAGNLALTTAGSTNGLRFGVYDSNYSWISSFNSLPLILNAGGNNVGINTTSPQAPLNVQSDANEVPAGWGSGPIMMSGATNSNKRLVIGFDTTLNEGYIQPYINGTGYNNLLLDPAGGNVGIGTASPQNTLHVNGGITTTGSGGVPGTNGMPAFSIYENGGTGYIWSIDQGITWEPLSVSASTISFLSNNSTQGFYQNSSGNVGIANASPLYTLDIIGQVAVGPTYNTGGSTPSKVIFKQANLAQPSYTNDSNGYINYYADPTGGTYIRSLDLVSGSVNTASRIKFFTSTNGSTISEAMRIDSTGNVGIGNTSPQVTLDATGTIRDAAGADASPYTNGRIFVYGGTGVDTTNWGYLGYGQDANMRVVYSNTSQNHSLIFGTSSASNNTGTFTPELTIDHLGDLTFANANPVFTSGGSWIQFPYGAYFSGGTSYFQTQAQFRAGVHNDNAAYMEFDGGTSGYSYFSGNVGIGTASPGSTLEVNGHIKSLKTYQTGSVAVNGSGTWQTVTFPTAFTSTPVVTADMSNLVGGYYGFVVINGGTLSTTSFQFIVVTMQNAVDVAGDTISWIAVAQ